MLSLQALFIFAEVAHSANAHNIHGTHLTPRQAEWGYLGETGPLRWGGICSTGNRQSPTVLDSSIPRSTIHPVASYTDVASANITNTGKTLETAVTGTINYPYKGLSANWKLLQFHFHTPSYVVPPIIWQTSHHWLLASTESSRSTFLSRCTWFMSSRTLSRYRSHVS